MIDIKFTVAQCNEMLAALGEIPWKYSDSLISFIKNVSDNQAQDITEDDTEDDTDLVICSEYTPVDADVDPKPTAND